MSYIVGNIDKREYLRPEAFGEKDTLRAIVDSHCGVMQGLVILLADGNNRGGGDLRCDHSSIGSWAGDRIVVIDENALMPEASEPGMEEVPYQQQLLKLGRDVSASIIAAIVEGEGGYSRLASLNPQHVLPLTLQAEFQEAGGGALLTAKGRESRFCYLEDLFGVLKEPMPLASAATRRALERGINRMAELFGREERYTVQAVDSQPGTKEAPSLNMWAQRDETAQVEGIALMGLTLLDGAGHPHMLTIEFGMGTGTTVQAFFNALFPGIQFEQPNVLGVRSPEVAQLLSFLKDNLPEAK